MKQMLQLEEVEVFYILPAIRSRIAAEMKKAGMMQSEIARLLCVQESTISQYLSSKRAADVKFNERINKEIASSAKRIKNKESLMQEIRKILGLVRDDKVICRVHRTVAELPEGCKVCFLRK